MSNQVTITQSNTPKVITRSPDGATGSTQYVGSLIPYFAPNQIPDLSGVYVAGRACTTDSSHGLPAPTGVGLEFVINADGLDDIRLNGASL